MEAAWSDYEEAHWDCPGRSGAGLVLAGPECFGYSRQNEGHSVRVPSYYFKDYTLNHRSITLLKWIFSFSFFSFLLNIPWPLPVLLPPPPPPTPSPGDIIEHDSARPQRELVIRVVVLQVNEMWRQFNLFCIPALVFWMHRKKARFCPSGGPIYILTVYSNVCNMHTHTQ